MKAGPKGPALRGEDDGTLPKGSGGLAPRPTPGAFVTLDIEKPTAGGRMLARYERQVVLVSNAIPGEQVRARIERVGKGVAFAEAVEVVTPSPDRRPAADWKCGGNVLSHIAYDRQLAIKAEIIRDAFARIGHLPLSAAPTLVGSPEQGYRMRARLHASGGRFGFYREGTRHLCDPAVTGQLASSTVEWIRHVEARVPADAAATIRGLELSENVAGDRRSAWLDVNGPTDWFTPLAGPDAVVDEIVVPGASPLHLRRRARSFFQGNRFLLQPMVDHVLDLVPQGPVLDLYAGVGLFGLALTARGSDVTLVEGDLSSGGDLEANAAPYAGRVRVVRASVEGFLQSGGSRRDGRLTLVIDPPRTGLSKEAAQGILGADASVIVYVSCDPATLARDARILVDAGYAHGPVAAFDLFPNTAHVEPVVAFSR